MKTAEYARMGHPDRVCDIIADSLLDAFIKEDNNSRVAIEVFGCHGIITVGGEVTTNGYINITEIVKNVYKEIGYFDEIGVQVNVVNQSKEIKKLADDGAGDSGIVTGYATNETLEMLPLEVALAKRIANYLDTLVYSWILPDGKVQVTIENENILNITLAIQTKYGNIPLDTRSMMNDIVGEYMTKETTINTIPFKSGGFEADVGLTGRKNVLWYGPRIPIGGGAFAGKDGTKVDRSGAYWARKIAVEQVKDGRNECLVEIAFVIGQDKPISCTINGEDMNTVNVGTMIEELKLKKPLFKMASIKGHFGYNECLWE